MDESEELDSCLTADSRKDEIFDVSDEENWAKATLYNALKNRRTVKISRVMFRWDSMRICFCNQI
jgi:hypothetical protein